MGDGQISFSQKYGYEDIPRQLKLEELPKEARTQIWNLFYLYFEESAVLPRLSMGRGEMGGPWKEISKSIHIGFDNLPLDEWDSGFEGFCQNFRNRIESQPFHRVFDLIEFILRHPTCPSHFVKNMRNVIVWSRVAYVLDLGPPPAIIPAVTPEEGASVVTSLQSLRQAGLIGSATHLREASARLNEGDWAGSVQESIHAVESVARLLDPDAAQTLGPALKSIDRRQPLHPALKQGFASLYGYTADEQGIRHALLNQTDSKVGQDEAVFMLGACASFTSYLCRKHVRGES